MDRGINIVLVMLIVVTIVCSFMVGKYSVVPVKQTKYIEIDAPPPDPNQIIAHEGRTNIYLYGETKIYVARKLE